MSCVQHAAAARRKVKVTAQLIRRYPHVLLIPLAVLALVLGLGIWGVQSFDSSRAEQNRQSAIWDVANAATALKLDIYKGSIPLYQMETIIKKYQNVSKVLQMTDALSEALLKAAPQGTTQVSFAPLMKATRFYSPYDDPMLQLFLGVDFMAPDSVVRMQAIAGLATPGVSLTGQPLRESQSLAKGAKSVARLKSNKSAILELGFAHRHSLPVGASGPYSQGPDGKESNYLVASYGYTVRISGVEADETWGFPQDIIGCPPGLCYDRATKTKVWGQVGVLVDIKNTLSESSGIAAMRAKGYGILLTRAGLAVAGEPDRVKLYATGNFTTPPEWAVTTPVTAVNQEWELSVWQGDNWNDNVQYLYAVVVIGAVVISALMFAVLLSWVENKALLHSLLPQETIDRMRKEAQWVHTEEEELQAIQLDTPAKSLLNIILTCLTGELPSIPQLVAMRDALQRSVDVYRPLANTVREKMDQAEFVDDEVRQALVRQLAVDGSGGAAIELNDDVTVRPSNHVDRSSVRNPKDTHGYSKTGSLTGAGTDEPGIKSTVDTDAATDSLLDVCAKPAGEQLQWALKQLLRRAVLPPGKGTVTVQLMTGAALPVLEEGEEEQHGSEMVHQSSVSGIGPAPDVVLLTQACTSEELRLWRPMHGSAASAATVMRTLVTRVTPCMVHVEQVLGTADGWSFNAYALEEASCGCPLSVLGYWVLHTSGLVAWADIHPVKLVRFLQRVEDGYSASNPYHNKRHAADVLQSMHVIMHRGGLMLNYVDNTTMLACYLAAIVHDFEHKGRNNDFLVNSYDELTVRYNDRSPMENHHLAAAFNLMRDPEYDCLSALPKPTFNKIRKLMIVLVLSTDMKQHFATLGQFDALHVMADKDAERTTHASNGSNAGRHPIPMPVSETDRLLSLQLALKCADLGHLTAPLNVHLKWVADLEEEFFQQGDAEKAQGLPISPLCDRTKEGVYKSQVGFIDFVVLPLFKSFTGRFQASSPLLKALKANLKHWQTLASNNKSLARSSKASQGDAK